MSISKFTQGSFSAVWETNTRWKALAEIYLMHSVLQLSNLTFSYEDFAGILLLVIFMNFANSTGFVFDENFARFCGGIRRILPRLQVLYITGNTGIF